MKKLNLEKLKLAAEDVLQRSQLAGIYGGSYITLVQMIVGGRVIIYPYTKYQLK